MKVLFMGTPAFAVPSLRALLASRHQVVAVFTQPDRPSGRGLAVRPSPVKAVAIEHSLPVHQPRRLRSAELPGILQDVGHLRPDALVVVAYGQILPGELLAAAPLGGVNVHASLLPRWRGAAPVAWAIASGDAITGVTTMRMVEKLDAGEIMLQLSTEIGLDETTGELEARLAAIGAPLLVETLDALEEGSMALLPQKDRDVTFAPMLRKDDGVVDWAMTAELIARRVRAFDPWPVARTQARGRAIQIWKARPSGAGAPEGSRPGQVIAAGAEGVRVACGSGTVLDLMEVQPEGKRRMRASEAAAGRYFAAGDPLGAPAPPEG